MFDPREEKVLVTIEEPSGFTADLGIVGCYLRRGDKYLFLKKSKGRNSELTWGVAGGRIEPGEHPEQGVLREVFEETGVVMDPKGIILRQILYVQNPFFCDYKLYLYSYECEKDQNVNLSDEHMDYLWTSLAQAKKLNLLLGGKKSLMLFEKSIT